VNGDGFDDVILGAIGSDAYGSNSGASYVVFGFQGLFPEIDVSFLNGTNGFKLSGVAAGDQLGNSVSAAGDVNGDGFGDVIVAAPSADPNGSDSGASYVVFGKPAGFSANLNLSHCLTLTDSEFSAQRRGLFRLFGERRGRCERRRV
jgi:hypothetical protein